MSKSPMPWNKLPATLDANAVEQAVENDVLKLLELPIRNAIRQAFVRSMGAVARGPMDDTVKPPKDGTICAAIWSELDTMRSAGAIPKLENILTAAQLKEWNPATTRTQYATWRRYHGIPAQQKSH